MLLLMLLTVFILRGKGYEQSSLFRNDVYTSVSVMVVLYGSNDVSLEKGRIRNMLYVEQDTVVASYHYQYHSIF